MHKNVEGRRPIYIHLFFFLSAISNLTTRGHLILNAGPFKHTQKLQRHLNGDFSDFQPALYHYNVDSLCK